MKSKSVEFVCAMVIGGLVGAVIATVAAYWRYTFGNATGGVVAAVIFMVIVETLRLRSGNGTTTSRSFIQKEALK